MFEDKTYDNLMNEKLAMIDAKYDKREGSVIYDALGPNSIETAAAYAMLSWMFRQMFGDTADREYLTKIAYDTRGMHPKPATPAVRKGEFDVPVSIGQRFSIDALNYAVTAVIAEPGENGLYTYQLTCETFGTAGNRLYGTLFPVSSIGNLTHSELTDILVPGEDDEDTELFRERWRAAFNSSSFGGNKADYREKIKNIPGVGGCKVYRAENAAGEISGGYVRCVLIDSDYRTPSDYLLNSVQEKIDPRQDGNGDGLAPIGHVALIVPVKSVSVNLTSNIVFEEGYIWEDIKTHMYNKLNGYFAELSETWEESSALTVRISGVENVMLHVQGILDVADTALNGVQKNLILTPDEIPILGEVNVIDG